MNNFFKITLITILASISLNAMQEPIRTIQKQYRFTDEEDKKLTDLVLQAPGSKKKWSKIAQSFPGRTTRQVRERWNSFLDPSLNKTPWTTEDEEKLITLHQEYGNKWTEMSKLLGNRPPIDIKCRWLSIAKKNELGDSDTTPIKKRFTPEEDAKIIEILSQHPGISWVQVAKSIPGKNARQIGHRFINYLDPHLNKTPWTTEEDEKLITLYKTFGTKWRAISDAFDNTRSPNDIKNRWISISKRPTTDSTIDQPLEIQKQDPEPTVQQPVPQPEAPNWDAFELQPVFPPETPNCDAFEFPYDQAATTELFSNANTENYDFDF